MSTPVEAPTKVEVRDPSPLESKKFLAFLIAEITSKVLLGAGLWILKDHLGAEGTGLWWWMCVLTVCTVFLEIGAILGIAYVDRFVRVAKIAAQAAKPGKAVGTALEDGEG
jgi:F0F1-type ATP synthase assembly protein I